MDHQTHAHVRQKRLPDMARLEDDGRAALQRNDHLFDLYDTDGQHIACADSKEQALEKIRKYFEDRVTFEIKRARIKKIKDKYRIVDDSGDLIKVHGNKSYDKGGTYMESRAIQKARSWNLMQEEKFKWNRKHQRESSPSNPD